MTSLSYRGRSGELVHPPSVLLTRRMFEQARRDGITDIQPNRSAMLSLAEILRIPESWLPGITLLRQFALIRWDKQLAWSRPETPYFPSSELAVRERAEQHVSLGDLKQHALSTGKTIVDLTVRDWDDLGGRLTTDLIERKRSSQEFFEQGLERVSGAFGEFVDANVWDAASLGPIQERIEQARRLSLYVISRS